ncbi:MAG: prepilin-type N-terminal cleavage/methylation domain-containing protein [Candidatus Omnitrophica bacterium]|nr:prepilin-type N-terminal cleavage/methylation domain-containing protein [Candidatus Omnitrophota bacterium]
MKKGFTLLEILIVVIIIAILATLGLNQYMLTVERSRGAEVKQIFGQWRQICAAKFMELGNTDACDDNNLSIGTTNDTIPSACRATHHFNYSATRPNNNTVTFTATRCTSGGKSNWRSANTVTLTVNYQQGGTESWTNTFGY